MSGRLSVPLSRRAASARCGGLAAAGLSLLSAACGVPATAAVPASSSASTGAATSATSGGSSATSSTAVSSVGTATNPIGAVRGGFRRELRHLNQEGQETVYANLASPTHEEEVAAFARLVRHRLEEARGPAPDQPAAGLASGEDGRRALAVSLAVLSAIERGTMVSVEA